MPDHSTDTAQLDYKAMQNRGGPAAYGSQIARAKAVLEAKAAGDRRTDVEIAREMHVNVLSVYKMKHEVGLTKLPLPSAPSTILRQLPLGDGLGVATYENEMTYAGESRLDYYARSARNYRRRRAAPRAALRLEGEVEVEVEQEESESEESEAAAMIDGDEVEEVALPFPSSTAAAPPRAGEEVEISAASGLLPEHLPHQRALCPLHPFHAAERPVAAPVEGNEAACPNCYCLVCDARVSECRHWQGGDPAHCNAHGDSALWRQKRVNAKRRRTRAAQVTQARVPCGTPGCSREAYHDGLCSAERAGGRTRSSG